MCSAVAAVEPEVPEEEVKYDFDSEFQTSIANLVCRDVGFAQRSRGLIKPDYFENPNEAQLVAMALEYQERYAATPSSSAVWKQIIRDAISDKKLRKEVALEIAGTLNDFFKSSISDSEFALDEVARFARHQALQDAMMKSVDLMEKGKFDDIEELVGAALRVGAGTDFVDYDFWAERASRKNHRDDIASGKIVKDGIKTGLSKLDKMLYHEGWGRKELSVIMGGAKKGKSMGLGYFAGRASLLGYNVLYATLEVSTDIIADREDACLSQTDMGELVTESTKVSDKLKVLDDKGTRGELRLIEFASGTLAPKDLERVLERYKSEGIKFDLIIVDYADIMAPDRYTTDAIENSKQIWLGLRAIAHKENAAVLTATQTNREGFKEATAKAEHAAEDFNKVRIADIILSINRTEEEADNGEARLYFAANRNGAGEFTMHIKQDLSKMAFITKITSTS